MSVQLVDDIEILAKELVLNGPIHTCQIPEETNPKTRLGRVALAVLLENKWAEFFTVGSCSDFIVATKNNPFVKGPLRHECH